MGPDVPREQVDNWNAAISGREMAMIGKLRPAEVLTEKRRRFE